MQSGTNHQDNRPKVMHTQETASQRKWQTITQSHTQFR